MQVHGGADKAERLHQPQEPIIRNYVHYQNDQPSSPSGRKSHTRDLTGDWVAYDAVYIHGYSHCLVSP
ncbi:hypothetical protein BofuT4_uP073040.1 [Botrytis cinerea T4]|uniref:Uncharacterized protein n=1 Tax=Botryotinia fuckeliana (strain T4) TaxID=999810 RepID=G2XP86_BOTF4|nr:hypothetical protein BofuT4_uP073040.1 [Botrytis cinerea T4]